MLLPPKVGLQVRDTVSRSGYLYFNPDCIRVASTCGFRGRRYPTGAVITETERLSASRTLEIRGRHLSLVFLASAGSSSGSVRADGKVMKRQRSGNVELDLVRNTFWVAG